MSEVRFVSGDEAVALAARQARPQVIAAYPITPQTIVVERLSDFVEDGSLDAKYMYVESEHSAMSACIGAAAVGARTFTATSSQGLLYMCECLHYASGSRFPIVMMDANRSTATPWNIYGDQRDSLSQLESGWIQLYVQDVQEAYDTTIQAYRIAEDPSVMLPVMICLDGFILTHTYEPLQMTDQEKVDKFIPYHNFANRIDFSGPMASCITAGPLYNAEFRVQQQNATVESEKVIEAADKEYGEIFGRSYGGMIDAYRCDDAEAVIISLGSTTGTVRVVCDRLRAEGKKVGVLRIRCMRPFPGKKIADAVRNAKAVAVMERDISFGYEGAVFSDVNSALRENGVTAKAYNYVGGLGGRSIAKSDIERIYDALLTGNGPDEVQFVNLRKDLDYGN
ncbi:MAG: transketolase C-terminal domain-containing protein [Anaerovoracaceae bacterium]|nr:transketolase C-terminal domain-containing protein [Anaerovoracaceae bacterium]